MASQVTKKVNSYEAMFRSLQQRLRAAGTQGEAAASNAWVDRLRETAFARFEQLGFPTTAHEEYKYTNVVPIVKTQFELSLDAPERAFDEQTIAPFVYEEARHSRLVFINNRFIAELSALAALPHGVAMMNFTDALKEERYAAILREKLARLADHNDNAFSALNTAFLQHGAFIHLPAGARADAPIHLLFLADARETSAPPVAFPRVLIVAERESAATVIESYASATDEDVYFTNAVVEIYLATGAQLEHYKVQREGASGFHVAATVADLERSSRYDATTITLGAQLSRHDINIALGGEGIDCAVDGLYIVGAGQHTDTHSLIDHRLPHCASHQLYKGILDGKSRAVFNGKIFVREGAQQTNALQTNRNLLLSNEARVDTKPQLEIFADDVKCTHGATVGQLEEEELFYLLSRGLTPEMARNLLTYGFAEEVINKIKIDSIRAQLDEAVLNRLHARFEA